MTRRITPKPHRIRSLSVVLSLVLPVIFFLEPIQAHASAPGYGPIPVGSQIVTSIAPSPLDGFWVQLDGDITTQPSGTIVTDGAPKYENFPKDGSIIAVPGTKGYWIVTPLGEIASRGPGVPVLCEGHLSNCSGFPSEPTNSEIIVGAAATPSGQGLWAVDRSGVVWTAGDAQHFGDVQNERVITGMAATLSGNGYYVVASDGGVFSFGDAVFYGSTGGNRPGGHNVTGIAVSVDNNSQINGYWLVADDGGILTFGGAPFFGSSGGNDGGSKVISMVSFPGVSPNTPPRQTEGYAWVHANGRVQVVYRPTIESTVVLQNVSSGNVMDVLGASKVAGTRLQQSVPDRGPSQMWRMAKPGTAHVTELINVNSGLCAETPGDNVYNQLVQAPCVRGVARQRWIVLTEPEGTVFLSVLHPDWALSVNAGHAGSGIVLWPYRGVPLPIFSWTLIPVPSAIIEEPDGGDPKNSMTAWSGPQK